MPAYFCAFFCVEQNLISGMEMIEATIVTIGDELLIGQVIDTNSSWMAQQLNRVGVKVKKRLAIADDFDAVYEMLAAETGKVNIVLITGGLGPTSDDITKEVLCDFFGGRMVVNSQALQNVKYLFESVYKKPMNEAVLSQAEVPDVCDVILNKRGTASGMVFQKEGTVFVSMPGVPYEMQGLMEDVLLLIEKQFELPAIVHRTALTAGAGESLLAALINDFERSLPEEIRLAYLPAYGTVRLRLSTSGVDRLAVEKNIDREFDKMKSLISDYLVSDSDESMTEVVGRMLQQKNKTLATAESCTGGAIASLVTSIPGASGWFCGSVVSYTNEVKQEVLQVKAHTLEAYGAVSEQTVIEMLQGVIKNLNTDYGIAVSGIMGPGGGNEEKPVGTVWIAVGNAQKHVTRKLKQRFDRIKNIEVTATQALNELRLFLKNEKL